MKDTLKKVFAKAAGVMESRGKIHNRLLTSRGVCALGALALAHDIEEHVIHNKQTVCRLGHTEDVVVLGDLIRDVVQDQDWFGSQDPCRPVYCWSDSSTQEHVRDVLFVLGEGDEDKARALLSETHGKGTLPGIDNSKEGPCPQ